MDQRKRIGTYLWAEHGQANDKWWIVTKRDDILGYIEYFPRWRQEVFYPSRGAGFNAECLRDISDFLLELRKRRQQTCPTEPVAKESLP